MLVILAGLVPARTIDDMSPTNYVPCTTELIPIRESVLYVVVSDHAVAVTTGHSRCPSRTVIRLCQADRKREGDV